MSPASGAQPRGELAKIADVESYVSKPADYPHAPAKLLLLLTSGTGIRSTNNRLQADAFAAAGFVVVMPDQFGGDPAPNTADPNTLGEAEATVIEQVKHKAAETVQAFMLDMWLARQTPEKVLPILRRVVAGIREEFADAVAYGGGIYAAGFCFGGKYVLLLGAKGSEAAGTDKGAEAASDAPTAAGPTIKVGAMAHGTMITREDLQGVAVPITMVCVENDQLFPDEVRKAGKGFLESNQVEHEIQIYPGVPHGFAVFGDYEDTRIKEEQKKAFEQMLDWLKSH